MSISGGGKASNLSAKAVSMLEVIFGAVPKRHNSENYSGNSFSSSFTGHMIHLSAGTGS